MNNPKAPHLTQDHLMQAILDKDQLPLPVLEHLSTCPACQEQKRKQAKRFNELKQLSGRIGSQPKPWYNLGRGGAGISTPRPFGLKFLLIIAMVVTLILLLNHYDPFKIKTHENTVQSSPYSLPTSLLPEIYSGLLTDWWKDENHINGLSLTSDEIGKLNAAWQEALQSHTALKKKIVDGQVELAVTLESKTWDREKVQHHYQQLSQNFARLMDQRVELLQKIRIILGYERFQELLKLKNR